jgi:hypothetical protein
MESGVPTGEVAVSGYGCGVPLVLEGGDNGGCAAGDGIPEARVVESPVLGRRPRASEEGKVWVMYLEKHDCHSGH